MTGDAVHGSRLPVDPLRHPVPDALGELIATVRRVDPAGALADYIPELARVDAHGFGIAATAVSGHSYAAGDSGRRFTIQLLSAEFGLHMLDRPRESVSAVESIRTDAATGTITIQVRGRDRLRGGRQIVHAAIATVGDAGRRGYRIEVRDPAGILVP